MNTFIGAVRGMAVSLEPGAVCFSDRHEIPVFARPPTEFDRDVLNLILAGGVTADLSVPDANFLRFLRLRNRDGKTIFEGSIRISV